MTHVMIDIETLGIGNDAPIVSIGAVEFDMASEQFGHEFHRKVKLDDPDQGPIDASTVLWWLGQSKEAQNALLSGEKVSLAAALKQLVAFMSQISSVEGIWANDPDFDMRILLSAYKRCDVVFPHSFRLHRSMRTMNWLACRFLSSDRVQSMFPKGGLLHDALSDAKGQAIFVSRVFNLLNGWREERGS